MAEPSFTCPRCGMTSYNPNDVREGYCGNCHTWTRTDPDALSESAGSDVSRETSTDE